MNLVHFILNIHSRGKGNKTLESATEYLDRKQIRYKIHICSTIEDTKKTVAEVTEENGLLIVIGGDGTIFHVVNAIEDFSGITLAFLGGGTGNDFITGIGVKKDVSLAMDEIINGTPVNIDLIDVGGYKCINVAGTGLDIEVLKRCERSKFLKGKAQYLNSLLITLLKFSCYDVEAVIDGEKHNYDAMLIAVGNAKYFGGGMMVTPHGDVTDGKISVTVVHSLPKHLLVPNLIRFLKGRHEKSKYIEHLFCDSISIKVPKENPLIVNIDGEMKKGLNFDCKILPSALRIIAPADFK